MPKFDLNKVASQNIFFQEQLWSVAFTRVFLTAYEKNCSI